jgi:adenylate kinase
MLDKTSESVTATVSIMIPDEVVMERIKGRALKEGRADDASEEIINTRIATYHAQTEPLIEYYTKAGKYHEADGVGSIEEIRNRIFTIMDRF